MDNSKTIKIEIFYTLTCPNCKILKQMLNDALPKFGNKFKLKKSLANSPIGIVRTMKLGIHDVPTLLINDKIVFKSIPTREELINKLKKY